MEHSINHWDKYFKIWSWSFMFYTSFCASVAFLDIRSSSHLHFLMLSIGIHLTYTKLICTKIDTFAWILLFQGRNSAQCHEIRHQEHEVHLLDHGLRHHPCVPLLHRRIRVLPGRLPHRGRGPQQTRDSGNGLRQRGRKLLSWSNHMFFQKPTHDLRWRRARRYQGTILRLLDHVLHYCHQLRIEKRRRHRWRFAITFQQRAFFRPPSHLRHAFLLHCHHHRFEPDLWCHHWYLCRSQVRKATEGRPPQELMFHLWYVIFKTFYLII